MYVFTTRADTIMGVTFCAVAAEHPLAAHAAKRNPAARRVHRRMQARQRDRSRPRDDGKEGDADRPVRQHPITDEPIEVWVGNYVLMGYGDGAVMGVPAHDERDFAFAKKYGLPIKQVIAVEGETYSTDTWQPWYDDKERGRCVVLGQVRRARLRRGRRRDRRRSRGARAWARRSTTYRLRDWGISRQRYWGTPIPIIHCDACGDVPVPEKDLPVVLPEDCVPGRQRQPAAQARRFPERRRARKCGEPAKRETDTMDTFVDSSWYYMRYTCPDATTMVDARNDYWMPMDQYIGGIEHAILHLLYARFWTKVMRDMGLVKIDEPFTRLFTQGMLLNHIYFRRNAKGGVDYIPPDEVDVRDDADGKMTAPAQLAGRPAGRIRRRRQDGQVGAERRRSADVIDRYGADTARLYVMFAGSPAGFRGLVGRAASKARTASCSACGPSRRRIAADVRRRAAFDYRDADDVGAEGAARNPPDAEAGQRRLRAHAVQHGRLGRHEDAERARSVAGRRARRRRAASRRAVDPAAHALPGRPAHDVGAVERSWLRGRVTATSSTRRGRRSTPAALVQDEIELVLQVNGKLRGKIVVPASGRRRRRSKRGARAAPKWRSTRTARR